MLGVFMKKFYLVVLGGVAFMCSGLSYASSYTCPNPQTTSLKWGIPPEPWKVSPVSREPQADDTTRFVSANILVAGYGQGVMCTYHMSLGNYSIWWQILTKIPARSDYNWIDTPGGFICTQGLERCRFEVAN